jgi:hypothetical protein
VGAVLFTTTCPRSARDDRRRPLECTHERESIAGRWPAYEAVDNKPGAFGGTSPEPVEAINTIAVSVRLVSGLAAQPHRRGGHDPAPRHEGETAAATPVAAGTESPDAEKASLLPTLPGTLAYLNGEHQSWLDETLRYY